MGRTFRDTMQYDAENVFLDANVFAEALTLHTPSASTLSVNQLLSLLRMPPIPDGDIDGADRRQLLGQYRFGDNGAGETEFNGIIDEDNVDLLQGLNLESQDGTRETDFAVLECSASLTIVTGVVAGQRSYITQADGTRWECLRPLGRDSGMQSIAIRKDTKVTTKRGRPRL